MNNLDLTELSKIYPDYKKSLKSDIATLKKHLAFLRSCEDRIIQTCRVHFDKPDDQDFAIYFWTYFTLGDDIDDTRRELERKERHQRILSGKQTNRDVTEDSVRIAKEFPIDRLMDFKRGFAPCLWHDERTGSMHYYPKSNRVKCFGCQKSADSIDVAMKLYGLSFLDAVKKLCTL